MYYRPGASTSVLLKTSWRTVHAHPRRGPPCAYNVCMNKTTAIEVLSTHFGAPYEGTFVASLTGNLIEDIMMEGDIGKTFHRFGKTIVDDNDLIGLANCYA